MIVYDNLSLHNKPNQTKIMKNTLHTTGPWKADLVSLKIWANDGNTEIARTSSDVSIQEEEANARLIASAPDLLSALESAYNAIAWDIPGENLSDQDEEALLDVLRAAIAKAKGGA